MARQISGVVTWIDNPIYSGETPVSEKHFVELENNIKLIDVDLEYHRNLESYEAHKAVTLTQPGFITPEIVKEISDIENRLSELESRVDQRVPARIIIMYDGLPSAPPDKWFYCNGQNGTPDIRGKYVLGGSVTATYPLHSFSNGETNVNEALAKSSGIVPHHHTFYNCWCCYPNDTEKGEGFRNPIPNDLRLSSWDWDNSSCYFEDEFDYVGGNASFTIDKLLPRTIKVPFIMRGDDNIKDCVITVHQPTEGGQISIDGAVVESKTVKSGTIILIEFSADEAHEMLSLTVDGESRGTPCYVRVYDDMDVVGVTGIKIINVKVNQNELVKTYINGEYVTDEDYLYGTKLTVDSDHDIPGMQVLDYTVTERGWSGRVYDPRSNGAVQSIGVDPGPIVDISIPFSETVEVKSKDTKYVLTNVNFEIPSSGTYRVKITPKVFSNFYGYRRDDAEVNVDVLLDGHTEASNTLSYVDSGEMLVNSVYSSMTLNKGKHLVTIKLEATAASASLVAQIIGGTVQVREIGVSQ